MFVGVVRIYDANFNSMLSILKALGLYLWVWSSPFQYCVIYYYMVLYCTIWVSVGLLSYFPTCPKELIISCTQKVGIHSAGCTVELVYNKVIDLFGYVGYFGLPFQICQARKIRIEKYKELQDYFCAMFVGIFST